MKAQPGRPASRQRSGRKRAIVTLLLFVLIAGFVNYVRPLPAVAVTRTPSTPTSATLGQLAWPAYGQAAIGAQGFGLLAEQGADQQLPTASVAKIITALAVLAQKPLKLGQQGASLTVDANDVAIYQKYVGEGGSVVPVTAGEQLTEYEILQAMLLPSANNIADSAAIWTFGSLSGYTTYANQMLKRLGLSHTVVAGDASGFLPHTVSTASDLVKLGEIALQNPVIAQVVAQSQAALPVTGTVYNVDSLLGTNGIIGIKTGNSDQAGGCFLFAANYGLASDHSITIVGAVLGAPDLASALQASLPLLTSAQQNFRLQTFAQAGQTLATYKAPWGGSARVVSPAAVSAAVWNGLPVKPSISLAQFSSGIAKNQRAGTITVHAGGNTTTQALITTNAIPSPSWQWRLLRNPF